MKTATVQIDGKDHEIRELKPKANEAWRKQLEAEVGDLTGLIASLPETAIDTPGDLARVAMQVAGKALGSVEKIRALCVQYDATLEEAYDSELAEALPAILGLAYPYSSLIEKMRGMMSGGPLASATSPNLVSANGASGETNMTTT